MLAIVRKELADSFNSVRFFVLFLLMLGGCGWSVYEIQQAIRTIISQNIAITNNGFVFLSLFTYIPNLGGLSQNSVALFTPFAVLIPIIGIALGFDAINGERTGRTMSRVLAQPVYRDGVINGKFLAGLVIMIMMVGTSMALTAGFGIRMVGIAPTEEEIIRLFLYFVIAVIYGAFWMGLAMFCSVVFRRAAGSLLVPLVLFIFVFAWMYIVPSLVPVDPTATAEVQIRSLQNEITLLRFSPAYLFQEAYLVLLNPVPFGLGVMTQEAAQYLTGNPLTLGESLLQVWPHIIGIISLSVVFFAISYIVFTKQEVRAT
jgi:ABC-2 type transport system permease protein